VQTLLNTVRARSQDLLDGFWFVPGLISLCGPVLALLCVWIDHRVGNAHIPLTFSGNASAASGLLSAIAGAVIAVLGLVFSITIVTLQLVTSQFTPRALRGFLADRVTQCVAGGFLGLFAFALVVLTTVHDQSQNSAGFVPAISITVAIIYSFVGLVFLLLFFNHTAESIQIFNITARLAKETLEALDSLSLMLHNGFSSEEECPLLRQGEALQVSRHIYATRSGYVQSIAFDYLLQKVSHLHVEFYVHLLVCPGDFVTLETVLVDIRTASPLEERQMAALRRCVIISNQRDIFQDAGFGMRQLTDIALRAMSPAVNDPTTAVNCIQYLQAIFERLVRSDFPSNLHHLQDGKSLLVARIRTFEEYIGVFVEIGRVATQNARVADALLVALEAIIMLASELKQEWLPLLGTVAQTIALPAIQDSRTDMDRSALQERLGRLETLTRR
jgi:uncharacterized membrane protein